MGNVIPWSQIHPSITSEEPFVAVVIIDPQRQICVSEMVAFEPEALTSADVAAAELIAAAQAAATKVASGYRVRRKQAAPSATLPERLKRSPGTNVSNARMALKRHSRGATPRAPLAWADGPGKRGGENPGALTLPLPLEGESEKLGGLRVLKGGKG
jgi:hypothetical protein